MGKRFSRAEQVALHVQLLPGIFSVKSVLSLGVKPARSVGVPLAQHFDELDPEAEEKGGVQQLFADHFAKVYKVSLPLAA
jgi:hypothetical protein